MSKAFDKTYDGIIIGAGHHGLILGAYLARAGLNILLVDRRLTYGGGLCTREVTLPGFYHNLHSINHFHISETPWFKDLNLSERVTYITPRYEFGQAHRDGSALVLGRDLEESIANVARFSKRDAQTFRDWNRKAEKITAQIFLPERYAERLKTGQRVTFRVAALTGREFTGRVDFVDPIVQLPARTITVKAQVPNPRRELQSGMFIEVRLATDVRPSAVIIAEDAVLPLQGANFVWVVSGGKATRRQVELADRLLAVTTEVGR